jgi:hypothetical protein
MKQKYIFSEENNYFQCLRVFAYRPKFTNLFLYNFCTLLSFKSVTAK